MRRLLSYVRQSRFARDTAALTMGTLAAQTVNVLATLVLSRLFQPADYGKLALYGAVVAICGTLITLRYEVRVQLPGSDSEAKSIVNLVVFLAISLGGVLALAALALPRRALVWIGLKDIGAWLSIGVLASVAAATMGVSVQWLVRRGEFRKVAWLRVGQAVLTAVFGIALGLLVVRDGLLYAQVVALMLSVLTTAHFCSRSLGNSAPWRSLRGVAKTHARAPLYLLPTAIIDTILTQMPVMLIASLYDDKTAGQYRMAWSVLGLTGSLVGTSFAQVFYQRFSRVWPDARSARALLVKSWLTLASIGLCPFGLVVLFGDRIFVGVLGEQWEPAGRMAAILSPMYFFSLVHSPTSMALVVVGLEKLIALLSLAVLIVTPVSFLVGGRIGGVYAGLAIYGALQTVVIVVCQCIIYGRIRAKSDNRAA